MANNHSARAEKVYVKVNSDFDSTGYIQPKRSRKFYSAEPVKKSL